MTKKLPIEAALQLTNLQEVKDQIQIRQDTQKDDENAWPEAEQLIGRLGQLLAGNAVVVPIEATIISTDLLRRAYHIVEKVLNPAQAHMALEVDAQRWLADFHKEFKVESADTGEAVPVPA
jgi:hypothetical protein